MKKLPYYLAATAMLFAGTAAIAQEEQNKNDMIEMDFEDLMGIDITSVSKKAERLQDVASSIYVITNDDIRKSGATTLHELLRNVPGYWGIQDEYNSVTSSVRYSSAEHSTKGTVLFLLDGTPILELMTSHMSYRNFDIPLDEIERIEIIKGSGGVIYGANSATGVVNIFTKDPDKYDGINIRAEGAAPGYVSTSLRAGGKVSEKLAISGYGKVRYFKGYGLLPEFDGAQVTVPLSDGSGTATIPNAYTGDFEASTMFSMGAKAKFKFSENTSIIFRAHYNRLLKEDYSIVIDSAGLLSGTDTKIHKNIIDNRLVSSIRLDHSFGENNSFFARISTNRENDYVKLSGGYEALNQIIDFEIQDNFTIGKNDFSVGVNYRILNFNIHDINSEEMIKYIDPINTEILFSAFIQDKISFSDKLDLIVGIKGENYTLLHSSYFWSPMAKLSYRPKKSITIWTGFTQSYATPGYDQTNLDMLLISAPSNSGINNVGITNGIDKSPARFQILELGFRANVKNKVTFETNLFYNLFVDGISLTPEVVETNHQSPTRPGVYVDYYIYGNSIKGSSVGAETIIKARPTSNLTLELSHTFLKTKIEYQENDYFDINGLTDEQINKTPDVPTMPENIIRFRASYDISSSLNISTSLVWASEFRTETKYRYENQRYITIYGEGKEAINPIYNQGTTIAENSSRFIFNIRAEKNLLEDALSVFVFGNDIFNSGLIAHTDELHNATMSQIGAMYGLGVNYKF